MAENKIFLYPFPTSWLPSKKENKNWNYTERGQKYLVLFLKYSWMGNFSNDKYNTYLIIPEDNSVLANEVKKIQQKFEKKKWGEREEKKNCFTTPFQNLKLIPDWKTETSRNFSLLRGDGLLVKDTSQVEKYSGAEPFSEITFKVIEQRKEGYGEEKGGRKLSYQESFSKHGAYQHILKIEPLNLGIERLPPITRLRFTFADSANIPIPGNLELTKSELYKSKILSESVGKTFSVKIKRWDFDGKNDETLHFSGNQNYVFGSFKETKGQEKLPGDNNNDNPPQPEKNPNQTNSPSNFPIKIVLLVGFFVIFTLLGIIIYYKRIASKKKKK